MGAVAVIPARYSSSRFAGKPLVDVAGKPMIMRVFEQVATCPGIERVTVATDDRRIFDAVVSFGGSAVMTDPDCHSGTDRVAQAVSDIEAEHVVNVQGDQVIIDPDALTRLVRALEAGAAMVTIAAPLPPDEAQDPNVVKVVCALNGDALYFSRSPIPFERNPGQTRLLKHVGIYGFTRPTLLRFTSLAPTPLERAESLEQLRALENGIPIRVITADGEFFEINTPGDLERLLARWRH